MITAHRVSPLQQDDPERLGDYQLTGRLGSGPMGTVFLGRDAAGFDVAIKTLNPALAANREARERFISSFARVRQVPHFCTAVVRAVKLDSFPPFAVTDYLDGPTLRQVVEANGTLAGTDLFDLALGLATALSGIHHAGVVHRNLNHDNVLLASDGVKVVDFEMACASGPAGQDPAVDILAWAALITYAATARVSPRGAPPEIVAAQIRKQGLLLEETGPGLRPIIERALDEDALVRPDAQQLLAMLHANRSEIVGGTGPATAPAAEPEWPGPVSGRPHTGPDTPAKGPHRPLHARPRTRHSRWPAIVLAVLVAAGLVAVGIAERRGMLQTGRAPALADADNRSSAPPSAAATARAAAPAPLPVPAEPQGGQPIIRDSLAAVGQWFYTGTPGAGDKCSIAGGMHVTLAAPRSFQCIGPTEQIEDDFDVRVTATLQSPGSCAAIWFHWRNGKGGHVLRACQAAVTVAADKRDNDQVFGRLPLSPATALGHATKIHVVVRNGRVDVYRDGTFIGTVPLPDGEPTGGQVLLGSGVGEQSGRAPYTVTLKDVDIRSL